MTCVLNNQTTMDLITGKAYTGFALSFIALTKAKALCGLTVTYEHLIIYLSRSFFSVQKDDGWHDKCVLVTKIEEIRNTSSYFYDDDVGANICLTPTSILDVQDKDLACKALYVCVTKYNFH